MAQVAICAVFYGGALLVFCAFGALTERYFLKDDEA